MLCWGWAGRRLLLDFQVIVDLRLQQIPQTMTLGLIGLQLFLHFLKFRESNVSFELLNFLCQLLVFGVLCAYLFFQLDYEKRLRDLTAGR